MPDTGIDQLVKDQFEIFSKSYPGFSLKMNDNGSYAMKGDLTIDADFEGETIVDTFDVEILIPEGYPDLVPKFFETGGRIPKEFHTYPDSSRCLGAPLAVKKKFFQNKTLISFVNDSVIPYLYSFSYNEKYGKMPYGELSHKTLGIIEYYREEFGVNDDIAVLGLLRILAENDYRGHTICPCGSSLKLRKCHGKQLQEFSQYQIAMQFMNEYIQIVEYLPAAEIRKIPYEFLIKPYQKQLREISHGA
jgi:hypothetical protein